MNLTNIIFFYLSIITYYRCFGNGVLCMPYICSKMFCNGDAMVKDVKRITQEGGGAPAVLECVR